MKRALIALGSNVGDSKLLLTTAVHEIDSFALTHVVGVSRLYSTVPVSDIEQPDFLNAAVMIETELSPQLLLEQLHHIEHVHGRTRHEHWGPRTLDLDIIDVEDFRSEVQSLQVPHPRAVERAFVLHPLNDIAPEWLLEGVAIADRIEPTDDVRVVAEADWSRL